MIYLVFTIVWGAYVRATGSGAGCGSHWPLCNGVAIPREPSVQTQIEYFHRLTSGLSLIFVLGLAAWVFRVFPKGRFIRKAAGTAAISIIMEALIGAGLVLLELVYQDQSVKRTVSIALHFVNTLVLLGSLGLVYSSLTRQGLGWNRRNLRFKKQAIALTFYFFILGMAGAITALGDTLFPSTNLMEGMRQDWARSSHFLIRLRVIHPLLALSFAAVSIPWIKSQTAKSPHSQRHPKGNFLISLIALNLTLGTLNLLWLAPIWLQMAHLFVALCVWMTWIHWVDRRLSEELTFPN
jgi:heme A synthase